MTDDVFKASDPEAAMIESLKGKFVLEDGSIDVDSLLKKAAHQEMHITKIEPENANLRKELETRLNYQDLVDKMSAKPSASNENPDPGLPNENNQNPGFTEDDLARKVESIFNKKQQEALRASNVQSVALELSKAWGHDYVQQLRQKAQELHLSEDYVKNLAMDNPKALLAIVLPRPMDSGTSFTPPQTRVNSSTPKASGPRNWEYYRQAMKKEPKLEYDRNFQNEMHDQASKQGDAFYS